MSAFKLEAYFADEDFDPFLDGGEKSGDEETFDPREAPGKRSSPDYDEEDSPIFTLLTNLFYILLEILLWMKDL